MEGGTSHKPSEMTSELAEEGYHGNNVKPGERAIDKNFDDTTSEKELTPVKTIAYCRFIAKRHKLAFGLALGGHLFLVFLTMILVATGYNVFPLDFTGVPLTLTTDDTYLRSLAWMNADYSGLILEKDITTNSGERTKAEETITLIYEGGNVFQKASLQAISDWENEIINAPKYSDFCQISNKNPGQCEKPFSIIRFFDGSIHSSLNDPTFDNIVTILSTAMANPQTAQLLQFHLGKNAEINSTLNKASSEITRSIIYLGHPDKTKRQDFIVEAYNTKFKEKAKTGFVGMEFIYTSTSLFSYEIQRQVIFDMMLAAGSFGFIIIFMLIQTQSLFITGFAVFSILTSFFGANLVYRIVLDYQYFGIFHVLSVFIILGIGADDVFVYYDTWRATAHENHPTLEERISACYRRASKAMFVTSLTTGVAFVVNALSPLLAVGSFGLFSGILVLVNYISVIVFFPTVVVMYHKHFETWTWPCCRCCKKSAVTPTHEIKDGHRKHVIVRFFRGHFFSFVSHPIVKWVLIAISVAVLCVFIYFATLLKPEEESIKIYKEDHNFAKATDRNTNAFKPSSKERVIEVYLIWGLKNQDLSGCHKTDSECTGRTVWDEGFDLNPKPAQNALMDLCIKIKNMTDAESAPLKIRRNTVTGLLDVDCFISDFDDFMSNEGNNPKYNNTDLRLPISEIKMSTFVRANPELYNVSLDMTNFYRYFETGLSYWLYDKYSGLRSQQFVDHSENIGFSRDNFDTYDVINVTGRLYGTRLRYAAIVVYTSLKYGTLGFETGIPIVNAWEDFATKEVARLPPSLSGGFQCTHGRNAWHWFKVQKTLATSAVQGIIIGICLAFPVLTIATSNVFLGFLATATIACVTVTIIGIIPLAGWKLGVLESLNLSLVVGLAVDYVVHLAEGYHLSRHEHRAGRLRDMLETVGISVLSGACTTLGASLFMLFAVILFFMQFGIFMFCTIGFSLFYSMLLFAPLLAVCGPQGNFGSLVPIYRWLRDCFKGKRKNDEDCKKCGGKGFHGIETEQKF